MTNATQRPGTGRMPLSTVTILLVVASAFAIDFPSLLAWVKDSAHFYIVNDDARQQVWPYLKFWDEELFVDDYMSAYYLSNIMPKGYSLLMETFARGIDPRDFAKILALTLYAATMYLLVRAAYCLGGWHLAWATAVIALGSSIFPNYTAGGLPKAFGFPIIALAALGLIQGRVVPIFSATMLGAIFYFVAGAICGLALFVLLFLFPVSWRGHAAGWTFRRRALVVGLTGFASLGLIALRFSATLLMAR